MADLCHALTTREGGQSVGPYASLNLGAQGGDDADVVAANRAHVASSLGFERLWSPRQVHGRRVVEVGSARDIAAGLPPEADAVVVSTEGVLAGVVSADCPLLLLVAPAERVLALAHAGWRGTAAGVVPAVIDHLTKRHGCDPATLRVALGPSISAAHYEVGPEVVRAFEPRFASCLAPTANGHARLDLAGVLRAQLDACGVRPAHVAVHPACTYTDERDFYSYRRDGERTGRHALVAGWRSRGLEI